MDSWSVVLLWTRLVARSRHVWVCREACWVGARHLCIVYIMVPC